MTNEAAEAPAKQISIQKIYIKDMSFESPQSPQVFSDEWAPETQLNLKSSHREVAENTHEVVLTITVDARKSEKSVFLVELQQAGLFTLAGIDGDERALALGSFCPSILYPYAREAIASAVQRGGFPEFILQPIDFDGLYAQTRRAQDGAAN